MYSLNVCGFEYVFSFFRFTLVINILFCLTYIWYKNINRRIIFNYKQNYNNWKMQYFAHSFSSNWNTKRVQNVP